MTKSSPKTANKSGRSKAGKAAGKAAGKRASKRSGRAGSRGGKSAKQPRLWWRACLLLLGLGLGFAGPYFWQLDRLLAQRMALIDPTAPSRLYGRPLTLRQGGALSVAQLEFELNAAGYVGSDGKRPGSFVKRGGDWQLTTRERQQFALRLSNGRVEQLQSAAGETIASAQLDPPMLGKRYAAGSTERDTIGLSATPRLLLAGVQAVEDRRFSQHHGIDIAGIARAGWTNLRAGEVVQGGSTLTQQLVKNLFFGNRGRWLRKIHEASLALLMEWRYDKEVILHGYLNEVFLGQQGNVAIHGFASAARHYFGLPLQQLQPHQSALLVALLKGPSYYNPWRNNERARDRRDLVLRMFYETGLLSRSQLDDYSARGLDVLPKPLAAQRVHSAFVDLVTHQLARGIKIDQEQDAAVSVYTTLSAFHQDQAEQAVAKALNDVEQRRQLASGSLQAALVLLDRQSGDVLATVGGRRAGAAGFNRVLNARRPVGSVVKPLVYRTALRDGYSLSSLVRDEPLRHQLQNGEVWVPANFSKTSHGPVPLIEALTRSYNQATAHLGLELGVDRVLASIRRLGWNGDAQANPSLLLGAIEMTPLEVAQLYLSLASDGQARAINAVREVRVGDDLRYRSNVGAGSALSPVNYLLTFALRRAVVEGTGRSLSSMLPDGQGIAGKTGTSNDFRDSWFVGFSDDLLAVVWVGRDDNEPAGVTGASGALTVFGELFADISWRPLDPKTPTAIEYAWVETTTGRLAASHCAGVDYLPFVIGTTPVDLADCLQPVRDDSRRKRRWWKFWR